MNAENNNCNLTTCRYNRSGTCTNEEKRKECVEVSKKVLCWRAEIMIRTVGELIEELEKYPKQMTVRIEATKPRFPNTMSAIDGLSHDWETPLNPDGAFPIVVINPKEF